MEKIPRHIWQLLWASSDVKTYKPALLPKGVVRYPVGTCFDACAVTVLNRRQYRYVEGIATAPDTGIAVLHAWITDGEYAFDPTWRATNDRTGEDIVLPCVYMGIELDIADVALFMVKTGYQGVLANWDRFPDQTAAVLKDIDSFSSVANQYAFA